jgi:Zn-dependent protease
VEIAAIVFVGWVLSVCLHEFGHALVAYWGGDTTVKDKGYLTFNILKYTDPQVTFVIPIVVLLLGGIALPGAAVYIDHSRLRNRAWESAVAAAGPYATAICAVLLALPFLFDLPMPAALSGALAFLVLLQVVAVLFNLLPVPGFDGFGVIEPWLPSAVRQKARTLGNFAFFAVLLLIWQVPFANDLLWGTASFVAQLLGVPTQALIAGNRAFWESKNWLAIGLVAAIFLTRYHAKSQTKKSSATAAELYSQAKNLFDNNQPADALTAVTESLKLEPNSAQAWHLRALCLGVLNHNEAALPCFDAAVKLKPDYADAWYNKACCHALLSQNDDAVTSLQEAIKLNSDPQLKEHARKDVGFSTLQADPRFQQLTSLQMLES